MVTAGINKERLTGEDVKDRVERRMARIDALSPEQRIVVHEFGWNLVDSLMALGISKPKTIRSIVNIVLHNLRPINVADFEKRDNCILAPVEPSDAMVDAGLRATNVWLNIPGSALTVNREKMKIRYRAMLAAVRG